MNVLYEDGDVLCVVKPPGIPCQPDLSGDMDLISQLSVYANIPEKSLYLTQRLDRPVGGVVLFGKNERAAGSLGRLIQDRKMEKRYLAVVCGAPDSNGVLEHYLLKNQRLNVSKAVPEKTKGAKFARLAYEKLGQTGSGTGPLALLKITLDTGRHHQIRVQTREAGFPLWGDTKYNDAFKNYPTYVQIGLYASFLGFLHPKTGNLVEVQAPVPAYHPFNLF